MLSYKIIKGSRLWKGPLVILLICIATGCTTVTYTQRIDSFRQAVNSSAVSLSSYYISLNEFERQLYLDDIALNPENDVLSEEKNGRPTALSGGSFSAASIKARTDALTLLGLYAQRLSDLAGSDAPMQLSNNVQALGTSLNKLDETFSKFDSKHDATAQAYTGPIAALISSIGRLYMIQKREQAVEEAVNNGAPKIRVILNQLENDFKNVIEPVQTTGLSLRLTEMMTFYNTHKGDKSGAGFAGLEERRIALGEIGVAAARFESAIAFSPTLIIHSLRDAHEKLVVYVNSPKDPKTFQEYINSLSALLQSADEIATQVAALKKL